MQQAASRSQPEHSFGEDFGEGIGVFEVLKRYSIRETIESILVAVALALAFQAFEVQAFMIPTGSMAPALQGEHMDVVCEECGYQYRCGASRSAAHHPSGKRELVTKTYCPVCRYGKTMKPKRNPDHRSCQGDRIIVNKFIYDFQDPERFDVIVFKNPNNGKQNYIKRLIGLPGDKLLIENGDIFTIDPVTGERQIQRKPTNKIDALLHLVDDTNHIAKTMREVDFPSRWNEWKSPSLSRNWSVNESGGKPYFLFEGDAAEPVWLRYRHLAPRPAFDEFVFETIQNSRNQRSTSSLSEWDVIEQGRVPERIVSPSGKVAAGALIRDYYEYNDRRYRSKNLSSIDESLRNRSHATHWVGDLAMDCELDVKSETGQVVFDLVEGGVHFQCKIDVATGTATLSTVGDHGEIKFHSANGDAPTASTGIEGIGKYKVRYAHLDDMVYMWVNDRLIEFNGSSYTNNRQGRPVPRYSEQDPGDAEPAGIASIGAELRIDRLKIYRDIYYVAPVAQIDGGRANIGDEITQVPTSSTEWWTEQFNLRFTYENPERWASRQALRVFDRPRESGPIFELESGQYLPMGDNSPVSLDARVWDGPKHLDEEYLIGRAMFVFWPHSLNRPVRYFPNFERMGFIR